MMSSQLEYAFLPSPSVIRASDPDGNPSVIDLQVIVNNSSGINVSLNAINITIPTGGIAAGSLSAAANLPSPVIDASGQWTITSRGSVISIVPTTGQTGTVGPLSIEFTLPTITVNETPGTVQISITEFLPSGNKDTDDQTYKLVKRATDYPVTNFYAYPPSLTDLNQPVEIYWQGSDQVVYDLIADVLPMRDCVDTGVCYSAADGIAGIATSPFENSGAYPITLYVIQSNSDGQRTLIDSLTITVNVNTPTIVHNSYATPLVVYYGQIVSLHWIALNAASVSVLVDEVIYDANAPLNTYDAGYPVIITNTVATSTTLTIIAYSASKITQDSRQYTIRIQPPTRIDFSMLNTSELSGIMVRPVPNSTLALAVDVVSSTLIAVDYRSAAIDQVFPLNIDQMRTYAITLDGQYAFFPETAESAPRTFVVNIPKWDFETDKLQITDTFVEVMAVHPSGNSVWAGLVSGAIVKFDLSKWVTIPVYSLSDEIAGMAFTPEGRYLLVASGNNFVVFDVTSNNADPIINQTLPLEWIEDTLTVTPDGTKALVAVQAPQIAVFDLTMLPAAPTYQLVDIPGTATTIAVTANSQRAVFVMIDNPPTVLSLYDILNQKLLGSSGSSEIFIGDATITSDLYLLVSGSLSSDLSSFSNFMLISGPYILPPTL